MESIETIKQVFENSGFNNYLGLELERLEEGLAVYSILIQPNHLNVNQTVHGGVYFSVLDTVIGITIRSACRQPNVTVNMNIHYFAPARIGETLKATAKILQKGKSIVTAEGEIKNANGDLLAKAVGTFKIRYNNQKVE